MFMIWDSKLLGLQLFWLNFQHCLLLSFHHIVYMTKGVQSMISQANTSGRSTGLTGNWQVTEIPLPPIIFDTEDNEVELFSTVVIVMMPYAAS